MSAGWRITAWVGRHLKAHPMPDGRPETAARSGVDGVKNQVFHIHVRWLEAGVARVQDLPGCGCQGPHPEPERIASGVLARSEPFIRKVTGVPQPYLRQVIARSLDLPLLACRSARRSNAACPEGAAGAAGSAVLGCRLEAVPLSG